MIRLCLSFVQFFRWIIAVPLKAKTATNNKFTGLILIIVFYSFYNLNHFKLISSKSSSEYPSFVPQAELALHVTLSNMKPTLFCVAIAACRAK